LAKTSGPDRYKNVVIDSLDCLSNAGKVDVFGFVIMLNHIHLIRRTRELNGKETPQGSFLKYTAYLFRRMLYKEDKGSYYLAKWMLIIKRKSLQKGSF
jgi:REP element-mobilizing transposase RayT